MYEEERDRTVARGGAGAGGGGGGGGGVLRSLEGFPKDWRNQSIF